MKTKEAGSPASAAFKISPSGWISFDLDVKKHGLEAIYGAAYLLTDRAFACLEGSPAKTLRVSLKPKAALKASELKGLAQVFTTELASQKVRWAIAKNNLPVREFLAEQAVLAANGRLPETPEPAAGGDPLTEDQRLEIEKLIAEVEDEIKVMNQKKAVPDPKKIAASWEEKREKESRG